MEKILNQKNIQRYSDIEKSPATIVSTSNITDMDDKTQHQEDSKYKQRRKNLNFENQLSTQIDPNSVEQDRSMRDNQVKDRKRGMKERINILNRLDQKLLVGRRTRYNNSHLKNKEDTDGKKMQGGSLTNCLRNELSRSPSFSKKLNYCGNKFVVDDDQKSDNASRNDNRGKISKPPRYRALDSSKSRNFDTSDFPNNTREEEDSKPYLQNTTPDNIISSISVNMYSYQDESSSIFDLQIHDDKISNDVSKMNFTDDEDQGASMLYNFNQNFENEIHKHENYFQLKNDKESQSGISNLNFLKEKIQSEEKYYSRGRKMRMDQIPSPILTSTSNYSRGKSSHSKKRVCFVDQINRVNTPAGIALLNSNPNNRFLIPKATLMLTERLMTRFKNNRPIFKSRKKGKFWIREVKDATNLNCDNTKIERSFARSRIDVRSRAGGDSVRSGHSRRKRRRSVKSSKSQMGKSAYSKRSRGSRSKVRINLQIGENDDKSSFGGRSRRDFKENTNRRISSRREGGQRLAVRCSKSVSDIQTLERVLSKSHIGFTNNNLKKSATIIREKERETFETSSGFYISETESKKIKNKYSVTGNFISSGYSSYKNKDQRVKMSNPMNQSDNFYARNAEYKTQKMSFVEDKKLNFKQKMKESDFMPKDSLSQISFTQKTEFQDIEEEDHLVKKFREIRQSLKQESKKMERRHLEGKTRLNLDGNFESFRNLKNSPENTNFDELKESHIIENFKENMRDEVNSTSKRINTPGYRSLKININTEKLNQAFKMYNNSGAKSRSRSRRTRIENPEYASRDHNMYSGNKRAPSERRADSVLSRMDTQKQEGDTRRQKNRSIHLQIKDRSQRKSYGLKMKKKSLGKLSQALKEDISQKPPSVSSIRYKSQLIFLGG